MVEVGNKKRLAGIATFLAGLSGSVFMQVHPTWMAEHRLFVNLLYVVTGLSCAVVLLQIPKLQSFLGQKLLS